MTSAAAMGLHLFGITALPGGFRASCAARRYKTLAKLARKKHVRLRVQKRLGLYFHIRAMLRRGGLWAGLCVFIPVLLWAQGLVWAVDYGSLSTGQKARAEAILRDKVSLMPGSAVTEAKLAAGEHALVQSGEFSWASLNFINGRLCVEAAAAVPAPEVVSGTLHGIRAKTAGLVVSTNLISGTMLAYPGQQAEPGQGLIGTARSERDGTLVFEPAAGSVRARFTWQYRGSVPLRAESDVFTGRLSAGYRVFFAGHDFELRAASGFSANSRTVTRRWQAEFCGLPLPFYVEETDSYELEHKQMTRTKNEALALARLQSLRELAKLYPDAEIKGRKEAVRLTSGKLNFAVAYTIIADICE